MGKIRINSGIVHAMGSHGEGERHFISGGATELLSLKVAKIYPRQLRTISKTMLRRVRVTVE